MRLWRLAIGQVGIDVHCDVPDCIPILAAMLRLYVERGDGEPRLVFRIDRDGDGMILSINGNELWHGFDAAETTAGFEVYFYLHTLDALQPACLSLHAATVGVGQHAVCLAGISGAGKSSLCTAALLDGAVYLSDEFSLLDRRGYIAPFPRPLQWGKQRHPAFTHAAMQAAGFAKFRFYFNDYRGKRLGTMLWFPPHTGGPSLPLTAVVLPTYRPDAGNTPVPLRRSQALIEIAAHMHQRLEPAQLIRELNRRMPPDTRFLSLPFSDARQAWQAVKSELLSG
ncbi:MAG TPA: hypothetical protein VNI58_03245 [Mariprofundaceae bacterium]|nr:hypothetical protein [Mariprofundaceae bacterium]